MRTIAQSIAIFSVTFLLTLGVCHLVNPGRPMDKAIRAVAEVRTFEVAEDAVTEQGTGSATMVDERGYLLTCLHVVAESDRIVIEWDGFHAVAIVVAHDDDLDLALLKIERPLPYTVAWGQSRKLHPGDAAYAIGYPFDLTRLLRCGIISSTNMVIEDGQFLVTDVQINPGDSGGGLFTDAGELVGVPARLQSVQGLGANIGIAYAIPGDIAHQFVTKNLPKE